jgi:hypothetical protein
MRMGMAQTEANRLIDSLDEVLEGYSHWCRHYLTKSPRFGHMSRAFDRSAKFRPPFVRCIRWHSRVTGCTTDLHPPLALLLLIRRHWRWLRKIVSKTTPLSVGRNWLTSRQTFDPSQTVLEWSAYCSTIGRMLDVTIRCARLKLWSISAARWDIYLCKSSGKTNLVV